MRLCLCVLWLAFAAPLHADPPGIVELSPAPQVQPQPNAAAPLDLDHYRWYGIRGYAGKVTWKTAGEIGHYQTAEPTTVLGALQGTVGVAPQKVPAAALVVWGVKPGTVTITAWGVVDGSAVELDSRTIAVGGVQPIPPGPGPNPPPLPPPGPVVTAGPKYLTLIEDTTAPYPGRATYWDDAALVAKLKAAGHTVRKADLNLASPPADLAPYIARAAGKKLPWLTVVVGSGPSAGKLLFEGALPATSADLATLLDKIGG